MKEVIKWVVIASLWCATIFGIVFCHDLIAKIAILVTIGGASFGATLLKIQGKW